MWYSKFLIAAPYKVNDLYHGTSIDRLSNILEQGLDSNKIRQNYLTPDLPKATRYGIGLYAQEIPVVFHINLSKPKRTKNLNNRFIKQT